MNTEVDILTRILKLFPVKEIKENFQISESGERLYSRVVENIVPQNIKDFAFSNINSTKQHVYIYRFQNNFRLDNFDRNAFPYPVINQTNLDGKLQIVISPMVEFKVILGSPFEEVILNFPQPYIITVSRRNIVFQATILEKNMMSYFNDDRTVIKVDKLNDEKVAINNILDYFTDSLPIECDLNKGVKHLWDEGTIDARFAKWKDSASTDTKTMDENFTLKEKYPEHYRSIIEKPINKTLFRYMPDDDNMPRHFTIDPARGQLSVALYPTTQNDIPNVITQILSNN